MNNQQKQQPQKAKTAQSSRSAEFACDTIAKKKCSLCDKDIISDVLGSQKSLITLYSTALCESSCKKMRTLVSSTLSESAADQYDMFLYMNERGLYPTENATTQKLSEAKEKYKCESEQINK